MKVVVKKLQGGECTVDVLPTTLIKDMKKEIADKLGILVEEQRLLLLGRTLADEEMVQSYPSMKEGTKIHLIIKKPDTFYEASVKYFLRIGMKDAQAAAAAKKLVKVVEDKFWKMSWDDIERIARNDENQMMMEYENKLW